MASNKAYRFAAKEENTWILLDPNYPIKPIGPFDVKIRVRATSLNYRDLIHSRRQMGRNFTGQVPLSDGAGEVVAIGDQVSRVKIGDRVAGCFFQSWINGRFEMKHHDSALGGTASGMLAQFVVLNENGVVNLPDHLTYEEAACLPCAAVTVWQSLVTRGSFKAGDTVLALGTGGVSIFAVQFTIAMGGLAIVTSSNDEKLEKARQLGAIHTVNYKLNTDWDKSIWQWTNKRGVDHILEVGGPGTLGKSMNCIAAGGNLALVGVLTGAQAPDASLFPLVGRNVTMNGIYVGSREDFESMNRFISAKKLRPVIDHVFPFSEANEALKYLENANHFGKVVVQVD